MSQKPISPTPFTFFFNFLQKTKKDTLMGKIIAVEKNVFFTDYIKKTLLKEI